MLYCEWIDILHIKKMSLSCHLQRLGTCYTLRYKMTLGNNTLSMGELCRSPGDVQTYRPNFANRFGLCVQFCNRASHSFSVDECFLFFPRAIVFAEKPMVVSDTLLYTSCPDCLVIHAKYPTASGVMNAVQLLSKTTFDKLTWWLTRWSDLQVNCYFWERGRQTCFKREPSLCLVKKDQSRLFEMNLQEIQFWNLNNPVCIPLISLWLYMTVWNVHDCQVVGTGWSSHHLSRGYVKLNHISHLVTHKTLCLQANKLSYFIYFSEQIFKEMVVCLFVVLQ